MKTSCICCVAAIAALSILSPRAALGQARETAVVQSATSVLNEIMSIPIKSIPMSMLADAQGVAILPNVVKIGFVAGGRRGRGVLLVRDEQGAWKPPVFMTITGGSLGWQAGVQSTDVVLVFKTPKSVEGLMRGKFTIGADAAAAAGPVGRRAEAATDARLKSEIYSYSRSRGLFAGVSLEGAMLQIDAAANAAYYSAAGVPAHALETGQAVALPASAVTLMNQLAAYTAPGAMASPAAGAGAEIAPMVPLEPVPTPRSGVAAADRTEMLKRQLALSSRQLSVLLDDGWRRHLALPSEVFTPKGHPAAAALADSLRRFEAVAGEARYRALLNRPEFRRTHELLRGYVASLSPRTSQVLTLPPPPR